jgi:hypothetical protein
MHRTTVRLLTTAAAIAALAVPAHASWTAPADAATRDKWEGPDFDAARASCAYQHNQTDLEFVKLPGRIEYPNLAAGFMDYTDDDCMS